MAVWYSESDVVALLDPAALIDRIALGFSDLAAERLSDRPPVRIDAEEHTANYSTFSAYAPQLGLATVKALSGVVSNPQCGRPMIDAVIVVLDAATGVVRALMDGRRITALRTAATSAVAVRLLAPGDGGTLAIVGTGAQAVAHAETLTCVRRFARVLVVSASGCRERAEAAAARVADQTGAAAAAADIDEAVAAADVIVVATVAKSPVVRVGSVGHDIVLVSVGSFEPGATEFDVAIAETADLVVADDADRLRATWQSTGTRFAENAIDLSGLVTGSIPPAMSGLRLFLSDGRGFEDLIAAALVLETAEKKGYAGQSLAGTLPMPT